MLARALACSVGTWQLLDRKAAGRFCSSVGARGDPTWLALALPGPDRPTGKTGSPCWLAGSERSGARHRSSPAVLLAQHNDSDSHDSLDPTGISNAGTAAAATLRAVAHFLPDILPFLAPLKWTRADRADLGGALGVIGHKGKEAGRTPISPINDAPPCRHSPSRWRSSSLRR